MPRKKSPKSQDVPPERQLFRYRVVVLEIANGSKRVLPLTVYTLIALLPKQTDTPIPDRQSLKVEDGGVTLKAEKFEELRTQLRERYPDEAFERRLFYERDLEGEKRREDALMGLARIFADAAMREILKEGGLEPAER